jgi:hypothetical protein
VRVSRDAAVAFADDGSVVTNDAGVTAISPDLGGFASTAIAG